MNDLILASSPADADAAAAVEQHHAAMAGALALRAESLAALARSGRAEELAGLRDDLVGWCRDELVPHALAEEETLYAAAAARPEGRLLVEAMLAEHEVIVGLVDRVARATDPVDVALAAASLRVVFEVHLAKENDQVLPLLVADPEVSVAELLGGLHELVGGDDPEHAHQPGAEGHTCDCAADGPGLPVLDARAIPHAIRHATIFGALDGVAPGRGLELVAPHDPLPLLAQLEQRSPGGFEVSYLERGPETWRLSLVRRSA